MRAYDILSTHISRPVVYIDLDGVLADMWGAVAQHHGVSNWRKARKVHKRIDKIAKKPGFFLNLKPLSNSGKLIRYVLKVAGKYSILSSPLLSAVEQSSEEKSKWLERHLAKHPPSAVLFDHEKFKYARRADGTPNILIDDLESNIQLWEANGGIGILYDNAKAATAAKQLSQALEGRFKGTYNSPLAVLQKEIEKTNETVNFKKKLWTNQEVLKYVKGIHDDYTLDDPILDHKVWELKMVPTSHLSNPENYDQDDPYRRVIDLDWDHIANITQQDIMKRPVVADAGGWVLDGNHRVTAARAGGIQAIPTFVPHK